MRITLMPIVSIIVPVYNTEKYLRPCLDSIQSQTFKDFEAVLVDDGSTDKSGEICDEYAAKDSRFVVVHKQNEGVTKARITAFEHSKGEYITFVDSDDIVDYNYIEKLIKPIIEQEADISVCQITRVFGEKREKEIHTVLGTFDKNGILQIISQRYLHDITTNRTGMPLYLSGKLFKRHLVKDGLYAGLDLKLGEDQIGLYSILLKANKITIIPEYLYDYIFHKGQATSAYRPDFWDNKLEVFRRYIELDKDNLLAEQLPLRMWRVLINGIEQKMISTLSSYDKFKELVVPIIEDDTFRCLFNIKMLPHGFKKNIKFWILKYKLFHIYYTIFIRHYYNKNK